MEVGSFGGKREIGILARDGDNKILFNDMINNNQAIFIDSEQTIYDYLKEIIHALNTSNYSVSKTANHFTKRRPCLQETRTHRNQHHQTNKTKDGLLQPPQKEKQQHRTYGMRSLWEKGWISAG